MLLRAAQGSGDLCCPTYKCYVDCGTHGLYPCEIVNERKKIVVLANFRKERSVGVYRLPVRGRPTVGALTADPFVFDGAVA